MLPHIASKILRLTRSFRSLLSPFLQHILHRINRFCPPKSNSNQIKPQFAETENPNSNRKIIRNCSYFWEQERLTRKGWTQKACWWRWEVEEEREGGPAVERRRLGLALGMVRTPLSGVRVMVWRFDLGSESG